MEQKTFAKRSLLDFLAELEDDAGDYLTVYATPFSFPRQISNLAEQHLLTDEIKEAIGNETVLQGASRYGTGAVVFWNEAGYGYTILPPFPVTEDKAFRGKPETSPLRQLLEKERTLGVVLVAWGSYALGVLRGDELMQYKTGTGRIHKRHRKGGSSQKRFARRTEEQKKDFLRRVARRVDEGFREYRLEHIFLGGNRLITRPLIGECSYLKQEVQQVAHRFLHVRYADRETLFKSIENIGRSLFFSY